MEKSEVQENDEWIRLYVELAVTFEFPPSRGGGDLEILDVSMDRMDEGLDAKNATFYISYEYSDDAWLGKRCHRIAAVRRSFDEDSGKFSLVGATIQQIESAKEIRPLFPNFFGVENNKRNSSLVGAIPRIESAQERPLFRSIFRVESNKTDQVECSSKPITSAVCLLER